MKKLSVEIWSDIACPWCYVGKRRFEAALAEFPQASQVEVHWRAFELDPTAAPATADRKGGQAERLAKKYGMSVAEAKQKLAQMTQTAAEAGLDFHFEQIASGNTFDAHRLLHWAKLQSTALGGALKERLLRAYFTEGKALGERETLVSLAGEVGLDVTEARVVLDSERYAADVRHDEREARGLGIGGVPFFVIGRYGVSGAQPPELLRQALDKAWAELPEGTVETLGGDGEGASCAVDGVC